MKEWLNLVNYNGLRWYKTDLHLHTTTSRCFEDQSVTPEQWVDRCIEQGLHCVAVTDHNSGDGIDAIKAAAGDKLIVFPGVEITSGVTKQHVLVLFDPEKGSSYVNEFLAQLNIFEDKRGSEDAYTDLDIFQIARIANERNGITIAAHIDQFSGVENFSYQANLDLINDPNIQGVQVVHKFLFEKNVEIARLQTLFDEMYDNITENTWIKWLGVADFYKDKQIAKLTFSDNPAAEKSTKHGLFGIGKNYTWIKMSSKVTIDSLRQALILPKYRITNNFSESTEPTFTPNLFIRKLEIENTIYNSTEKDTITFSPQLTSIIGGRGTGKSSILRIIRTVLNLEDELELYPDLYKEQNEYCTINIGDTGIFKSDSKIKLELELSGSVYEIMLRYVNNKKEYELIIHFADGTHQNVEKEQIIDVLKDISINIFSQKQIYEISREPSALRDFIDSNIYDVQKLKDDLERKFGEYKSNNIKIFELEKSISIKPSLHIKLRELEIKKKSINISAIETILHKNTLFKRELDVLENKKELLFEKHSKYLDVRNLLNPIINLEVFREDYKLEISNISTTLEKEIAEIELSFDKNIKKLEELIVSYREKVNSSNWFKDYSEVNREYSNLQSQTTGNVQNTITEYKKIEESIVTVQNELSQIDRLIQEQENLKRNNIEIIDTIKEIRSQIKSLREDFCKSILSDNPLLQVEVKLYRDKNNFINSFREVIGKSNSFDNDIETIVNSIFRGNVAVTLEHFKNTFIEDCNNQTNDLGLTRLHRVLHKLEPEKVKLIDLIFPEDEVLIKYKANDRAPFKPLSNASAGQKTSAILTLLLSCDEHPLLLDQPEDDLDNSLIYDLIVDRIIKSKNSRQIVIVTHNANIPVNGDSDLINVMNSTKLELLPERNGSIDDDEIRESICNIMEGGPAAFKLRAKKYSLKI